MSKLGFLFEVWFFAKGVSGQVHLFNERIKVSMVSRVIEMYKIMLNVFVSPAYRM